MSLPLIPGAVLDSIYDLDPKALREWGIRLVLADLDNTLTPYEVSSPSPALFQWKEALAKEGIALYVVSNSRKSHRCPNFCAELDIPFVRHAGKPGTKGFLTALQETDTPPEQTIMVGDQIFTDILGANRAGISSVLVRPLAWGKNPLRRVRYAAETPFRFLGRRNSRHHRRP